MCAFGGVTFNVHARLLHRQRATLARNSRIRAQTECIRARMWRNVVQIPSTFALWCGNPCSLDFARRFLRKPMLIGSGAHLESARLGWKGGVSRRIDGLGGVSLNTPLSV